MDLVTLIVVVVVVALLIWAFQYFPIPQPAKNILIGVIILVLALWLLSTTGLVNLRG